MEDGDRGATEGLQGQVVRACGAGGAQLAQRPHRGSRGSLWGLSLSGAVGQLKGSTGASGHLGKASQWGLLRAGWVQVATRPL